VTQAGSLVSRKRHQLGGYVAALWDEVKRKRSELAYMDLAVLALLPFIVMLFNDSWTFLQPVGTLDPYVYTGYFFNLEKYMYDFPNAYYGSRFPWVLLGAGVHAVFSPGVATLVLRLLLYYGATIAIYVTVRALWHNRTAALATAVVLGTHTQFLQAIGWNNADGPATVCLLIAIAFLAVALEGRLWPVWLVCAGAALTTAPSVHLFVAPFTLVIVLGFLINNLKYRRRVVDCVWLIAAGGVLAFMFFSLINHHIDGDFWYPRGQWDTAKVVNDDQISLPVSQWLPFAGYLIVPFVALMFSVLFIAIAAFTVTRRSCQQLTPGVLAAASSGVQLILVVAYYVLFDFWRGATLQFDFYASYMLAPAFVVLGGVLSFCLEPLSSRWRAATVGVVLAVCLAPFVVGALQFLPTCATECAGSRDSEVFTALAIVLGAAAVLMSLTKRNFLATGLLVLAALVPLALINVRVGNRIFFSDTTALKRQSSMVFHADAIVRQHNSDGQLRFWYDLNGPYGYVFRSIGAMHLANYRLVSEDLPARTGPETKQPTELPVGREIVILSADPEIISKVEATLSDLPVRLQVTDTRSVQDGPDAFTLTFVRIVKRT
jgi:hypothetical protein